MSAWLLYIIFLFPCISSGSAEDQVFRVRNLTDSMYVGSEQAVGVADGYYILGQKAVFWDGEGVSVRFDELNSTPVWSLATILDGLATLDGVATLEGVSVRFDELNSTPVWVTGNYS